MFRIPWQTDLTLPAAKDFSDARNICHNPPTESTTNQLKIARRLANKGGLMGGRTPLNKPRCYVYPKRPRNAPPQRKMRCCHPSLQKHYDCVFDNLKFQFGSCEYTQVHWLLDNQIYTLLTNDMSDHRHIQTYSLVIEFFWTSSKQKSSYRVFLNDFEKFSKKK